MSDMEAVLAELHALRAELKALKEKVTTPASRKLTVLQAAARLGCERTRVFELLKEGRLKRAPSKGRHTLVTLESVEALDYEARPKGAPARPARPAALPPVWDQAAEEEKMAALRASLSPKRGRNGDVIGRSNAASSERQNIGFRGSRPLTYREADTK